MTETKNITFAVESRLPRLGNDKVAAHCQNHSDMVHLASLEALCPSQLFGGMRKPSESHSAPSPPKPRSC